MSGSDVMKFDIQNNEVIAVYEYDDGVWELESPDGNTTYSVEGDNVIETEVEHGVTETTVYTAQENGTYIETSSQSQVTDDSSSGSEADGNGSGYGDDLMRFEIQNNQVIAVFEWDDGFWEREHIDANTTYTLQGDNVIEVEVEHGYTETKVYTHLGNGSYVEISSETQLNGSQSGSPSSDVYIDGQLFEREDENEYSFDLSQDAEYRIDDDLYLVRDGVIYELEDDGFYQKDGSVVMFEGERHEVEFYHSSLGASDEAEAVYAKRSDGSRVEVEDAAEAYSEDGAVYRLYRAVFDRDPDEAGFKYWADRLDDELGFDQVIDGFLGSDEFHTLYAGTDDPRYVTKLYNHVLKREPDEEGLRYWVSSIEEGRLDRGEVLAGFSESSEFKDSTQQALDDYLELVGQTSITTDMIA